MDVLHLHHSTVGVAMNLCGCVLVNGGTNYMKLGVMRRESDRAWRLAWYPGAFCFAVGNVLNFASFSKAPQSLLACVGASQFLTNLFFARCLLEEEVALRTLSATAVIISGTLFAVHSAPHESTRPSADDIIGYYVRLTFLAYAALVLSMILACEVAFNLAAPKAFYRPLCFCAASAMVGTFAVVQGKCLAILISDFPGRQADDWGRTVALIILSTCILVATQGFWLTRMQQALGLFDGSVIPLLQVCWTTFSIVTGGIFFRELEQLSPARLARFSFGLLVMMSGVYLLLPKPSKDVLADPVRCSQYAFRASIIQGTALLSVYEFGDGIRHEAGRGSVANTLAGRSRSFAARSFAIDGRSTVLSPTSVAALELAEASHTPSSKRGSIG